jgi:hypothetical protein
MMVKCWNCGNEMEKQVEKSGVEEYKASLLANVRKLEEVFSTVGDNYRASAYEDIIYLIENFDG